MQHLESRKRLLIAESEVNRALLARDYREMAAEARHLAQHVRRAVTLSSAVAAVLAGVAVFRRKKSNSAPPGNPWLAGVWKLSRLIIPVWAAWQRGVGREKTDA